MIRYLQRGCAGSFASPVALWSLAGSGRRPERLSRDLAGPGSPGELRELPVCRRRDIESIGCPIFRHAFSAWTPPTGCAPPAQRGCRPSPAHAPWRPPRPPPNLGAALILLCRESPLRGGLLRRLRTLAWCLLEDLPQLELSSGPLGVVLQHHPDGVPGFSSRYLGTGPARSRHLPPDNEPCTGRPLPA